MRPGPLRPAPGAVTFWGPRLLPANPTAPRARQRQAAGAPAEVNGQASTIASRRRRSRRPTKPKPMIMTPQALGSGTASKALLANA